MPQDRARSMVPTWGLLLLLGAGLRVNEAFVPPTHRCVTDRGALPSQRREAVLPQRAAAASRRTRLYMVNAEQLGLKNRDLELSFFDQAEVRMFARGFCCANPVEAWYIRACLYYQNVCGPLRTGCRYPRSSLSVLFFVCFSPCQLIKRS